jgi:hypothetical protein
MFSLFYTQNAFNFPYEPMLNDAKSWVITLLLIFLFLILISVGFTMNVVGNNRK